MRSELQLANHIPAPMLMLLMLKKKKKKKKKRLLPWDLTSIIMQDWYQFLLVNVTSIFQHGQDLGVHPMLAVLILDHIPVLLCLRFFIPQIFTECLLHA